MENKETLIRKNKFKIAGIALAYPVAYLYWRLMTLDIGSDFTFVGPTIFCLIFIAWNEITLRGYKERSSKGTIFWYAAMVITSLLSTFSPSFELSMFAIHLCAIYAVLFANKNLLEGKTGGYIWLDILRGMFIKGIGNIQGIFVDGFKFSKERKELTTTEAEEVDLAKKEEKRNAIFFGFIIVFFAFILLIIVAGLLSNVNSQFGDLINKFVSFFTFDISQYIGLIILRMFLAIPVSILLYGAVSKCASEDGSKDIAAGNHLIESRSKTRIVSVNLINVVLSVFIALYIVFFVFEGSYIFGALIGRIPEGFNVVSYARNGFFELIWVMAINMMLYLLVNTFTRRLGKSKVNKILLITIMSSSIVFAIVSFVKLFLYFSAYGYTPKRILAMWGAVVLAAAAAFVIVSILKSKSYARTWIIFAVVSYIVMCVIASGFNIADRLDTNPNKNDLTLIVTNETDMDISSISMSIDLGENYFDLGNAHVLRSGRTMSYYIPSEDLPRDFYSRNYEISVFVECSNGQPYYGYFKYDDGVSQINIENMLTVDGYNELIVDAV